MRELRIRKREHKNGISYEYRFEAASVSGKRKFITKSGFKTKTEAKEEGRKAQEAYEKYGTLPSVADISYADFLDIWINSISPELKSTTLSGYKKRLRLYIKPTLGYLRLKNISNESIQSLINELYDKGMSINTLTGIIGIITKSFRYAVIQRYLETTPIIEVKIPKNKTPTKKPTNSNPHVVISREWMKKIFERFPEGSTAHIPLQLGYKCGMRLGEAFGLIWDDIDFEKKEIKIRRQVQWQPTGDGNGYWYFSNPKYNSFRIVNILDDELYELLKREKERQEKDREYYDEYYTRYYLAEDSEGKQHISTQPCGQQLRLVNIRRDGTYCQPRIMQHASHIITSQLGCKDFDFHSLRHTHATELVNNGARPEYVKDRLGHKKIEVTMNIYYHMTDEERNIQSQVNKMF